MAVNRLGPEPEKSTTGPLVMYGRRGGVEIAASDDVDTKQLKEFLTNGFEGMGRKKTWGERVGDRLVSGLGKIVNKVESGENDPENGRRSVQGGGIIRRTLL